MNESFDMLLNRDKSLNKLSEHSKILSEDSGKMKSKAKHLKMSYYLRKYMTYIVVAIVVLFLMLMKIYVL